MKENNCAAEDIQADVTLSELRNRISQASTRDELIDAIKDALEFIGILEIGVDLKQLNKENFPYLYIASVRGVLLNRNIPVPPPFPPPPAPSNTPRDADYYNNADYLRYDLAKFARAKEADVCELRVTGNEEALCANHERVKWQSYLLGAGVALGMAEKQTQAARMKGLILITLFKKAGYEVDYDFHEAKTKKHRSEKRADLYLIKEVSIPEK